MNAITGRKTQFSVSKPNNQKPSFIDKSGLKVLGKAITTVLAISSGLPVASCIKSDPCPKGSLFIKTPEHGSNSVGISDKMTLIGPNIENHSGIYCIQDKTKNSNGDSIYARRLTQYENGKERLDVLRLGSSNRLDQSKSKNGVYTCSPEMSNSKCKKEFHSLQSDYIAQETNKFYLEIKEQNSTSQSSNYFKEF